MSEAAWDFVKTKWDAYIGQVTTTADQKVQQLKAACSPELLQRMYDSGSYPSLTTEELLLTEMEKLAVIKVHKAVHTMNLWKMTQMSDETGRAFAARITGTADLCGMTLECSQCQAKNSYRDQVVLQVLLHGMRDNNIRSKVLSRNTTGDLSGLHKTIDYIEVEEAGYQEASNLHEHIQVNTIHRSTYQQLKSEEKKRRCGYCGGQKHGDSNSLAERRDHCRAWGKTCSNCKKENHLANVCRSKSKPAAPGKEDLAQVDSIAPGGFFPISVSQPPDPPALPHPDTWPSSWTTLAPPASLEDLLPIIANITRQDNTPSVTTIPLPHHVHSHIDGWLKTKPESSPTHLMDITLDRQAYAQLSVPIPNVDTRLVDHAKYDWFFEEDICRLCGNSCMLYQAYPIILHFRDQDGCFWGKCQQGWLRC